MGKYVVHVCTTNITKMICPNVLKIAARKGDITVKGKPIPLQTWTGPQGSRRLRLPDF
jgi:hypothetical protein